MRSDPAGHSVERPALLPYPGSRGGVMESEQPFRCEKSPGKGPCSPEAGQ